MKKSHCFLLSFIAILLFCAFAAAQKGKEWEKYKSRTLAEIPLINREATDDLLRKAKLEDQHDFISYDFHYSRVKVEFTGQQRAVSPSHQELIKTWSKLQKIGKKITSLYENEFLFREGSREYWIPVQKKVEEAMLKEIKANDMMTLFVIHAGGRKAKMANDYEWLFLSTAFEK